MSIIDKIFKGKKEEETPLKPFNLEDMQLSDTAVINVTNPLTGEKGSATIEIFNKFSDEYDLAQFEALKYNTYKEKRLCVIVGITKEIKGFYFGDVELTSSKEDIKKLYETCPMFIQEVDNFFSDVNNFFLNK